MAKVTHTIDVELSGLEVRAILNRLGAACVSDYPDVVMANAGDHVHDVLSEIFPDYE